MSPAEDDEPIERITIAHIMTRMAVGGAQESALAVCARADRGRFDQILVVGSEAGPEGELFTEAGKLGVDVEIIPALVRALSPMHDIRATGQLVKSLRRRKPDIVHTHSSKAGILGRVAARLAGVPIVIHSVHGWSFHGHLSPRRVSAVVALERLMARFTTCLVVEADSDLRKGSGAKIGAPKKYFKIRNGIDLERFNLGVTHDRGAGFRSELGIPHDAPLIGTVIRLVPQKNPQGFVRAAGIVLAERPSAHFVLVGDGPLRGETMTLAASLGVDDRIHFTGIRRDVADILPAFQMFVLSSHWEGLPRVVMEAMAFGIPVIAPDVDGMAEAVSDGVTGRLVAPGDPAALARAIVGLIDDPDAATSLGSAGRSLVTQRFDLRRMVTDFEALYERLAKAPGGTPLLTPSPLD